MAPPSRKRRMAPEAAEDDSDQAVSQRRRDPVSDDSDEEDETQDAEGDVDMYGEHQVVKKFVRYALACEFARLPITRAGIREKVLPKNRGAFKRYFDETQKQLRNKFGMEMIPLPVKEKVLIRDRIAAQKTKGQTQGTASYILTSTLPPKYRSPDILPPSVVESPAAEATYIGLYTMVISLISLNGGSLTDNKLTRYITRMNAETMMGTEKTDLILKKMERQGYIFKTIDNQGDEQIAEYHVGPRGKIEVGNKGIKGLVTKVYGENPPDDLEKRIHSSLGMEVMNIRNVEDPEPEQEDESGAGESSNRRSGRRRVADLDDDDE